MATVKSFTDLQQSKKLAEILPIESADCFWDYDDLQKYHRINWFEDGYNKDSQLRLNKNNVCAWSLATLLKYLSEINPQMYTPVLFPSEGKWILQFVKYGHGNVCEVSCNNPVDACVAMIEKLNELKML